MNSTTTDDPFSILGVSSEASEAEVRARYLELVRQFPPDTAPEEFRKIRWAYEAAKDPLAIAQHLIAPSYVADDPPSWQETLEAQKKLPPKLPVHFLLSLGNRELSKPESEPSDASQARHE